MKLDLGTSGRSACENLTQKQKHPLDIIRNRRPHYSANTPPRRVFHRSCVESPHISSITRSRRGKTHAAGKIDVARDRSSSMRHRRRFSSRGLHARQSSFAFAPGGSRKKKRTVERRENLTLRGLKADQLRVLALARAVERPYPGVVKRVEVQPVHRADGLAAAVNLLRIKFQTVQP